MEGTVTISIKNFDTLREKADKLDKVESLINYALEKDNGEIKAYTAVRVLDKIAEEVIDY